MKENKYLTEICDNCKGTGKAKIKVSVTPDKEESCWRCKGGGKLPNNEGQEILDLVSKFGPRK